MKNQKELSTKLSKCIPVNIHNLMVEYGMSRADLANRLSVSISSVGYWLTGDRVPRLKYVDQMCQIFHCTRSDILEDKTQKAIDERRIERLMEYYYALNEAGKEEAIERIREMTLSSRFMFEKSAHD